MSEFHKDFARCRRQIRARLWVRQGLIALAVAAMVAGVLALLGISGQWIMAGALVAVVTTLNLTFGLPRYRAVTDAGLATHFDRLFPELEESSHLLLTDPSGLSVLQTMQRERTAKAWPDCVEQSGSWLPSVRVRDALLLIVLGLILAGSAETLRQWWQVSIVSVPTVGSVEEAKSTGSLLEIDVSVIPPAYTGLPDFNSTSLDLVLPEGSTVRWQLRVEGVGSALELDLGKDHSVALVDDGKGLFSAETIISRTGLYQIVEQTGNDTRILGGIHTLTVTLDKAPRIRVLQPEISPLEIQLDDPVDFLSQVEIKDEFGIDEVQIRASVAKGSGEGVKFRDELFTFDSQVDSDSGSVFLRDWNLESLGMEPGDEVYFYVTASDNRQPEANVGRSETIIVRWLDEESAVELAEGFGIDVMPDYFKSQRQIIIETEQLISDRADLNVDVFEDTSQGLGQAQSDLKQRYGQYLGDEVEGEQFDSSAGSESESEDGHDEADDDDHQAPDVLGHDHVETGPDTSGSAADLIARFAHDHGASDIGPITSRNPVGLMKRSISNMWQAELHLRLYEPEKALPYEYEALKYLNLARQAERIYTRRLGFEPPPVSEEKRYAGDLDEILEYDIQGDGVDPADDNALFRSVYSLLSGGAVVLEEEELGLLENATERLTEIAQQRPAMIRHAATLEQIRRSGRLELPDCDSCVADLRKASWTLSNSVDADPRRGARALDVDDELQQSWLRSLEAGGQP